MELEGGRECKRRLTRRSSVTFAKRVTYFPPSSSSRFFLFVPFFSPGYTCAFSQQSGLFSRVRARTFFFVSFGWLSISTTDSIGALFSLLIARSLPATKASRRSVVRPYVLDLTRARPDSTSISLLARAFAQAFAAAERRTYKRTVTHGSANLIWPICDGVSI